MALMKMPCAVGTGGSVSETQELTNIAPYNYAITLPFHPKKFMAYLENPDYYSSHVFYYYDEDESITYGRGYDSYSGWGTATFTINDNTVTLSGSSTSGFNGHYIAVG
jgi:hypothetical protein